MPNSTIPTDLKLKAEGWRVKRVRLDMAPEQKLLVRADPVHSITWVVKAGKRVHVRTSDGIIKGTATHIRNNGHLPLVYIET